MVLVSPGRGAAHPPVAGCVRVCAGPELDGCPGELLSGQQPVTVGVKMGKGLVGVGLSQAGEVAALERQELCGAELAVVVGVGDRTTAVLDPPGWSGREALGDEQGGAGGG
jgi:hypothetical protein